MTINPGTPEWAEAEALALELPFSSEEVRWAVDDWGSIEAARVIATYAARIGLRYIPRPPVPPPEANSAYFTSVQAFVDACTARGMMVVMFPTSLGGPAPAPAKSEPAPMPKRRFFEGATSRERRRR